MKTPYDFVDIFFMRAHTFFEWFVFCQTLLRKFAFLFLFSTVNDFAENVLLFYHEMSGLFYFINKKNVIHLCTTMATNHIRFVCTAREQLAVEQGNCELMKKKTTQTVQKDEKWRINCIFFVGFFRCMLWRVHINQSLMVHIAKE